MSESSSHASVGPFPSSDGSDYMTTSSRTRTRSGRKLRGGGNGRSQRQRRSSHQANFTHEPDDVEDDDIEGDENENDNDEGSADVENIHFGRRESQRLTGASDSKPMRATRCSLRHDHQNRAKRKADVYDDEIIPRSRRTRKSSSNFATNIAVMEEEDNSKFAPPHKHKGTRKLDSRKGSVKKIGGAKAKNKRSKPKASALLGKKFSQSPECDSEENFAHSDVVYSGSEEENWLGSWRDVDLVEENVLDGIAQIKCKGGSSHIPKLTKPQPLFVIKGKKTSSSVLDVNNPDVATDLLVVWDFLHMMSMTDSEAFNAPLPDAKRYKQLKKKLKKRNSGVMRDEDDELEKKQQQYANINWTNPLSMPEGGRPSLSQLADTLSDPEGPWLDILSVRLVDMLHFEIMRLCTQADAPFDKHGDRVPSGFSALTVGGTRPNSVTWPEFLRQCIGALSLLWKTGNIGEEVAIKPSRWLLGQHDRSSGAAFLPSLVIPAVEEENNNGNPPPGPPQRSSLSMAAKTRDLLVKDALTDMLQNWARQNGGVIETEIVAVQKEQKLLIETVQASQSVPAPTLRLNEQRRSREVEKLLGISPPISGSRGAYTAVSKYGKENIMNFVRPISAKSSCPKWVCLILDIKDLPTKNGGPLRNNLSEAARLVISSTVRATLEASLSDKVYRSNSCGRTKEMGLGVLVDWILENPGDHVQHFTGISINEEGQPLLPGTDTPMKDLELKNPHDLAAAEGVEASQVHTAEDAAVQGSEMGIGLLSSNMSISVPVVDEGQASRMSHVMRRARALLRFLAFIPETRPFHLPVNRLQFRNYDRHVRRPMDMREVDRKLARGEFGRNLQSFLDEVGLIWRNAQKYNDPSSDVAIAARHFSTVFDDLLREWVLQPWMDMCAAAERNGNGDCNGGVGEESHIGRRRPHALTAARALVTPVDSGGDKVLEQIDAAAEKAGVPLVEKHVRLLLAREPWSDGCQYCRMDVGHENTLVCDGCDREYHLGCMNPPIRVVPEGDWYCTQCRTSIILGNHPPTIEECSKAWDELKIAAGKIITVTLETPGVVDLATSCRCIIRQLAQKPEYACFLEPVDLELYTDYLDYVVNPMDFRTIDRRLESGYYISPRPSPPWPKDGRDDLMCIDDTAEFQHKVWVKDMRSVASNAQKYNSKGGDVYESSRHLREDIDKLYKAWILAPLDGRDGSDALLPSQVDELMALNGGWDDGCMICGMTCYDIVDDGKEDDMISTVAAAKIDGVVHSSAAAADQGGKATTTSSTVGSVKDRVRQHCPSTTNLLPPVQNQNQNQNEKQQHAPEPEISSCQGGEFLQKQQQEHQYRMITQEQVQGHEVVPMRQLEAQPMQRPFSLLQQAVAIVQQQQQSEATMRTPQAQPNVQNHLHLQQQQKARVGSPFQFEQRAEVQQDVQLKQYTAPSSLVTGHEVNKPLSPGGSSVTMSSDGRAIGGNTQGMTAIDQEPLPPPLMPEPPPKELNHVKEPSRMIKSEPVKTEMTSIDYSEKKGEKEDSLEEGEEPVQVQEYVCCIKCGKLAHMECLKLLVPPKTITNIIKEEAAGQNGKADTALNWLCPLCQGVKEEFNALRKATTQLHELTPSLEPWRDTSTGVGVKRIGVFQANMYSSQGLEAEGFADEDSNSRMSGRSNPRRRGQHSHTRLLRSRGTTQKIVVLPCMDCHEKGKTGLNCRVVQSHHRQVDYVTTLAGSTSRRWMAPQGFFEWLNGELPDAEVVEERHSRDEERKSILEEKANANNKKANAIIATGGIGEGEDPNSQLYLVMDDIILPKLMEDHGWTKRDFVSGGTKRIELFSSDGFRTQSKRGMARHIVSKPDQYSNVIALAMEEAAKRAPPPTKKAKIFVERASQIDSSGNEHLEKKADVSPPNWDGVNLSLLGSVIIAPSTEQASQGLGVLEGVVTGFNSEKNALYTVQYSGTALSNGHVPYWTDYMSEEQVQRALNVTLTLLAASEKGCPYDTPPSFEEGELDRLVDDTTGTSERKDGYAIDDWCLSVSSQLRKDSLATICTSDRLRMLRIIVELSCNVGPIKEHIEVLRVRSANFRHSIAMLRYDWLQLENTEKKYRQRNLEKLKQKSSSKQKQNHKHGKASSTKRAAAGKQKKEVSKQCRPSKAKASRHPRSDGVVCLHNLRPRYAYDLCSKCYSKWRKQVKEEKTAAGSCDTKAGGSSGICAAKVKSSSSCKVKKKTDEGADNSKGAEDMQDGVMMESTTTRPSLTHRRARTASVRYGNYMDSEKVDEVVNEETPPPPPAMNFDCEKAKLLSKTAQLRDWGISTSTQVQYVGKDAEGKKYFCFRGDRMSLYTKQPNGLWGRIDVKGVKSLLDVLRVRVESRGGCGQWPPPSRPLGLGLKKSKKGRVVQEERLLHAIKDFVWMTNAIQQAETEKRVRGSDAEDEKETDEVDKEQDDDGGDDKEQDKTDINNHDSIYEEEQDEGKCPALSDVVEYCMMRMPDGGGGGARAMQCRVCCGTCTLYARSVRRTLRLTDLPYGKSAKSDGSDGLLPMSDVVCRTLLAIASAVPPAAWKNHYWDSVSMLAWRAFVRCAESPRTFLQALLILESGLEDVWLSKWWINRWGSLSVAMRTVTLQGVLMRAYVLDSAIEYSGPESESVKKSIKFKNDHLSLHRGVHGDACAKCFLGGSLLCCDYCPLVYHLECLRLKTEPSSATWACPSCTQMGVR